MANEFFEDDEYYTGPPLTPDLVDRAERSLGLHLPHAYLDLLQQRNGGVPRKRCYPTQFPTSWAPTHFEVSAVLGLGGRLGVDAEEGQGSADLIREWGYPDLGVVVCDTPSRGHDTVMLDYTECGKDGEPRVVYVDEDRVPRVIASSFSDFLQTLVTCPEVGRYGSTE
ncbi:SMI1/KNR4 family protein [Sinomonas mesophila]|uniref:SMI1/KNR4 family protein n=1 Tax=Sinomonas mesophila TaxID=1531955 RepID=UPI0009857546